jgi:hypothetical protein
MKTTIVLLAAVAIGACGVIKTDDNVRKVTAPDGRKFRVMTLADGTEAVNVSCLMDRDRCLEDADKICESTYDIVREETVRGSGTWTGGLGHMDGPNVSWSMWVHCWNPSPPWAETKQ